MITAIISLMLMTSPSPYHWMTPELHRYTQHHAQANGLKPELVRAVIQAESSGRPYIVSRSGAIGLMQVMPFHVDDELLLFDAERNIMVGCQILGKYHRIAGGDIPRTLKNYNAGPRGRTWPQKYIAKILKFMEAEE